MRKTSAEGTDPFLPPIKNKSIYRDRYLSSQLGNKIAEASKGQ